MNVFSYSNTSPEQVKVRQLSTLNSCLETSRLNPKNTNRQPPSLLIEDDSVAPNGTHHVVPPTTENTRALPFSRWSRRILPILYMLMFGTVGITLYTLRDSYDSAETTSATASVDTQVDVLPAASIGPKPGTTQQPLAPQSSSALIVHEPLPSPPTQAPKVVQPPPKDVAKTVSPRTLRSAQPTSHLTTQAAKKAAPSSDVDVLIALMRYSEDGKSSKLLDLQDRLDNCPAPNTRAGIQCRQKICAQPDGEDTLCPGRR